MRIEILTLGLNGLKQSVALTESNIKHNQTNASNDQSNEKRVFSAFFARDTKLSICGNICGVSTIVILGICMCIFSD